MDEILERPGRRAVVKVSREEIVLMEFEMEPDTDGAGPHFHREHVDAFYVIEGELEVTVAGETVHARPGELVHAAPGVVHSFKNSSAAARPPAQHPHAGHALRRVHPEDGRGSRR